VEEDIFEGTTMNKRYEQVARKLAADIGHGIYPVGTTLPSEPVLAETLGVSRSTVRAALSEIQQLGMVSRRPGLGTRVDAARPPRAPGAYAQTIETIDALVQYAAATRRSIIDIDDVVADSVLATRLGAKPGSRWLRVTHIRNDRNDPDQPPICWTDVYVAGRYARDVEGRVHAHEGAISELIEELAGRRVTEIEQTLRATGIPEIAAETLLAPVNGHALEITRRYFFSAKELAEISISLHPADRFAYTSKLSRLT
jgi:DNA-binding GntR family transcriptional regulator